MERAFPIHAARSFKRKRSRGREIRGLLEARNASRHELELLHSALGPKFDAQINLLTEVKISTNEVSKGVAELVTLGRAQQQGRSR